MPTIDPKNLTAQIDYRARGNPPSTQPRSSVSNCFPGLEFDLRNLWNRLLAGVELHELLNVVVAVEPGRPEVEDLENALLTAIELDGEELPIRAPATAPGPTRTVERANAFADLVARAGETVRCRFRPRPRSVETSSVGFGLQGLLVFDADPGTPWVTEPQAAARAERITFDFGTRRTVREILVRPAQGLISIFPRNFAWETSDDGVDFSPLFEETGFVPSPERFNVLSAPVTEARFLRWTIRETRPFTFQAGQVGFLIAVGDIAFDVPEVAVELEVRPLFEGPAPVWSEQLAAPGELTQSLCSPWQNDFRDCGCFYWAASRPDFVNVVEGSGQGHNWMDAGRTTDGAGNPLYVGDTIRHEDLFRGWESPEILRFVVGGRDAE